MHLVFNQREKNMTISGRFWGGGDLMNSSRGRSDLQMCSVSSNDTMLLTDSLTSLLKTLFYFPSRLLPGCILIKKLALLYLSKWTSSLLIKIWHNRGQKSGSRRGRAELNVHNLMTKNVIKTTRLFTVELNCRVTSWCFSPNNKTLSNCVFLI